jgi:hypothetical protein
MADCLRFLRLGLINILGVTVPGLLLLGFFAVGVFLPVAILLVAVCQECLQSDQAISIAALSGIWAGNRLILSILVLVIAYVVGYIIRLSTPDDLDRVSARHVLDKMAREVQDKDHSPITPEERVQAALDDHWPTRLEEGDKFPYNHFRDYLESRGLTSLATLVKWGSPGEKGLSKRSKTHVNTMKLQVLAKSPDLSAVIESNEAHVRLMFGTWVAIMACWRLMFVGVCVSAIGLAILAVPGCRQIQLAHPPFATTLIIGIALLVGMYWARTRIESLFHYQRVRELTHIVACAYYAEGDKGTNRGMQATSQQGCP